MLWWLARLSLPIVLPHWLVRWRVWATRRRYRPIACTVEPVGRRIFVDLTVIARRDVQTGIQRVVRSTVTQLLLHPDGRKIQPVRYNARAFRHFIWPHTDDRDGMIIDPTAGDVFLGLDLSLDAIRRDMHQLLQARRAGVRFWFVVYDLLPLQAPQHFSSKLVTRFRWWLIATAKLADGYACISQHTARELRAELALTVPKSAEITVAVIPMGFEIAPEVGPRVQTFPFATTDIVLAVGTLEPRKGYDDLLNAFDLLWAGNCAATLVIVGAPGWKTAKLQRRVRTHAEFGRRLHWMTALNDAGLATLYDCARVLVAASYGEGFGLPVLEAIARDCPVLARDIPAFRANAHHGLRFFSQHADPGQLANAIHDMLREGVRSSGLTTARDLPTWRDTASALLELL